MPQVEVTFDIDANGILNVKAKDKATSKEQSIRIEASSGLSKDDIDKMQKEAEANATEDAKKKGLADVKNTAEQMIYTAEKSLREAQNIPEEIKKGVQDKIEASRKELAGSDEGAIKSATESLSSELTKIGEYMKANPSTGSTGSPQASSGQDDNQQNQQQGSGPDVKDAEYKEEDKKDDDNK